MRQKSYAKTEIWWMRMFLTWCVFQPGWKNAQKGGGWGNDIWGPSCSFAEVPGFASWRYGSSFFCVIYVIYVIYGVISNWRNQDPGPGANKEVFVKCDIFNVLMERRSVIDIRLLLSVWPTHPQEGRGMCFFLSPALQCAYVTLKYRFFTHCAFYS